MPSTKERIDLLKLTQKKPITASEKELKINPPSRSAKLRFAIKKEKFYDFETDIIKKFQYLLDIEDYSKNI